MQLYVSSWKDSWKRRSDDAPFLWMKRQFLAMPDNFSPFPVTRLEFSPCSNPTPWPYPSMAGPAVDTATPSPGLARKTSSGPTSVECKNYGGNGACDVDLNNPECNYDKGDCCPCERKTRCFRKRLTDRFSKDDWLTANMDFPKSYPGEGFVCVIAYYILVSANIDSYLKLSLSVTSLHYACRFIP